MICIRRTIGLISTFLKNAKEQFVSFAYQVNEGYVDIEIKKYLSSVNQAWGFELALPVSNHSKWCIKSPIERQ